LKRPYVCDKRKGLVFSENESRHFRVAHDDAVLQTFGHPIEVNPRRHAAEGWRSGDRTAFSSIDRMTGGTKSLRRSPALLDPFVGESGLDRGNKQQRHNCYLREMETPFEESDPSLLCNMPVTMSARQKLH
jgi:hypothetical protein